MSTRGLPVILAMPYEYDSYPRTSQPTTTRYGGRGLGASDGGPAEQKLDGEPWLRRIGRR
jgi:hypothetical protein